jgi:hypothetical protein
MPHLPRKIVVVFQIQQRLRAKMFRDMPVDAGMVRRRITGSMRQTVL